MPRETIKSVKRESRRVLHLANMSHAAALAQAKADRDAAIDRLVQKQATVEHELTRKIAEQGETIRSLRADLQVEGDKMSKEVGDHSLTQIALRAANDRIADLQAALTQTTLVMRELGKRPEA